MGVFRCGYKFQAIAKQWFEVWRELGVCSEVMEGTVGGTVKAVPAGDLELGETDMSIAMGVRTALCSNLNLLCSQAS